MEKELIQTFKHSWNLWYHSEKDNWDISGYEKMYEIKTPLDFWQLFNNWKKLGGILSKQFFIMKNNIKPIWEDENNRKGGCWSFKININQAFELWKELSVLLVCDELLSDNNEELTGISICLKKNNNCVIKLWNKNSKNNSINLINHNILEKWGTDIIYIAHMSNK